jgi:hypothetical protein
MNEENKEDLAVHFELAQMHSEIQEGINSLDDDDQIPAVIVMRLALKRIETIQDLLK